MHSKRGTQLGASSLPVLRRRFAEAVFGVYQEGDVVWVQDYHLMLLPALLKKQKPKMKVRPPDRLWPDPASALLMKPRSAQAHVISQTWQQRLAVMSLVCRAAGGLVPTHAVPVVRDLPHAAGARGGAAGGAEGRPDRVPHLRLRAALHQLLHPHPWARGVPCAV